MQCEQHRLRDLCQRDAVFSFGLLHFSDQRPTGKRLEDRVDRLDLASEDRILGQQLPAHAPPLRSVAGVDEGDRPAPCAGASRCQARDAFALQVSIKLGGGFAGGSRRDGQTVTQ